MTRLDEIADRLLKLTTEKAAARPPHSKGGHPRFLYVWQRKGLRANFVHVWQGKELGLFKSESLDVEGREPTGSLGAELARRVEKRSIMPEFTVWVR